MGSSTLLTSQTPLYRLTGILRITNLSPVGEPYGVVAIRSGHCHYLCYCRFLVHLRKCSYHTALSFRNALKIPLDVAFGIQTSDKESDMIARSHFLANPPRQKFYRLGICRRLCV